jgi:hypothetical protein
MVQAPEDRFGDHRTDVGHAVADKGLPGLIWWARPADHVFGDRGLADVFEHPNMLTMSRDNSNDTKADGIIGRHSHGNSFEKGIPETHYRGAEPGAGYPRGRGLTIESLDLPPRGNIIGNGIGQLEESPDFPTREIF